MTDEMYSRVAVYFKEGAPVNMDNVRQIPSTGDVYRFMSGNRRYEFVKQNVNYVRYVL